MPTIPKKVDFNATTEQMLNAIRNSASAGYQERVPIATQENIRETGSAITALEADANEFLNALVNRIVRVIISSKMYQNPLRMFKKGMLEYGETIEEIFVNIAKAHEFDPAVAEKEVFKREIPDVNAVFHKMNLQNFYKVTISHEQLKLAFLNATGLQDLVGRIVDSLYSGANYDEFIIMKQLLVQEAQNGNMYAVNIPSVNANNAKGIVSKIKSVSNQLEFMNSKYNAYGVMTYTPKEEQYLIIDADFDATIDVEVLASAFNMDKASFTGHKVLIDNFAELTGVVACLVDGDWFMVFDNLNHFTDQRNGEGLYYNYWYHVWKTFSTSPFHNAVLFTTETVGITSITITPNTANVGLGTSLALNADVTTAGYAPKNVMWSIKGNDNKPLNSTITASGVLNVGGSEENTEITVTATSIYDPTKKAEAIITIV